MNTTLAIATMVFSLLLTQQSLAQTTTTLNFDSLADGTAITTQFAAQGINAQGAIAIDGPNIGLAAKSGRMMAYASTGLMTFTTSIANVKTVSAYVSGPIDVGIFAYDAADNLLGSALLPANAPANTLLSVTSSGAAIAKVAIHDGGATFFIDDLSFVTAAPQVPVCRAQAESLYNAVNALSSSAFVCSRTATSDKARILKSIVNFESLRASKAGQKKLLASMQAIQKDVKSSIKAANSKSILQQINQLIALINNNGC